MMTGVLLDAVAAHHRAADNGRTKVPASTTARLRRRYRHALSIAFRLLPPGPPPRRRNTGGWAPHQRDSWNLAVRFRDGQADVLRFLTDTRISPTNNDAERPLRPAKLHDKIGSPFVYVGWLDRFGRGRLGLRCGVGFRRAEVSA